MTLTPSHVLEAEKLLPCPFCGGDAELRTSPHVPRQFGCRVVCETCGVHITRIGSSYDEADLKRGTIDAWNTRPAVASALALRDAEIERLRSALKPFADEAAWWDDIRESSAPTYALKVALRLTVQMLRDARSALKKDGAT